MTGPLIEIVDTPPLNTVQDLGRPGFRAIGLCQGGAMDNIAARVGNIMVGNDEKAAVIEVQTYPFAVRVTEDCLIAATGAEAVADFGGVETPGWWAMTLPAGHDLKLQRPVRDARTYLAFAGGLEVGVQLGSRSTDLRSGFGGHEGRGLQRGDRIALGKAGVAPSFAADGYGITPPRVALPAISSGNAEAWEVRVLPGPEHDLFDAASRNLFWNGLWSTTPRSDRMGMLLEGAEPLRLITPRDQKSAGILPGVIQVPPSGSPLIQLSDANSAGGYPRIGVVAQADLWRLAQTPVNSRLKFIPVGEEEAIAAKLANDAYVDDVRTTIVPLAG